jgi:nucleoside-diphosphate-sugar epimerase
VFNRGVNNARPVPPEVHVIHGDARDDEAMAGVMSTGDFDVVVNWVAYQPEHVHADVARFTGRIGQYVFISSASAYQTPPGRLPVTESTPLRNPYWKYSRDKIACEDVLVTAYREDGFPATIVRPSHTYDETLVPLHGGWTVIDRLRRGLEIVVHGDGTSLWTLTHHEDFARGFVPLLGRSTTVGESFHVTSEDPLTWDRIAQILAAAAGVEPRIIHVPSDRIAIADPEWGASLLGDKAHSMVFDNAKLRREVPEFRAKVSFEEGAEQIVHWYDGDPKRRQLDPALNLTIDRLVAAHRP